jgi:hypothetical protein
MLDFYPTKMRDRAGTGERAAMAGEATRAATAPAALTGIYLTKLIQIKDDIIETELICLFYHFSLQYIGGQVELSIFFKIWSCVADTDPRSGVFSTPVSGNRDPE